MNATVRKQIISVAVIGALAIAAPALAQDAAPPTPPAKPKIIVPKQTPVLLEKGKLAYAVNCVACHGELGDGMGPAGAMLNPKPRNFAVDPFKNGEAPEQVFNSISDGIPTTVMVAFGHVPEEDRWGLTYYVLTFRPAGKAPGAKVKAERKPKAEKQPKAEPVEEKK